MLNMILKDLRISPLRNILTGISMFVGIIAMISSVLVGTLGKEYLISVNAQMYGWSPTYSFSITGSDFQDTIKMENFFREIYNTDHFVAVTFSMLELRHKEAVLKIEEMKRGIRRRELEEKYVGFQKHLIDLKEKYEFSDGEYQVIAPKSIDDILYEGDTLHHCVNKTDTYFDRIVSKESYILFLREKENPKVPFYTLEVEPDGTIRQKRAEFNRQNKDIDKVTSFLTLWQKEIQKRLTKKDRKSTEESRKLRQQNYQEIRDKHVVVHGGTFAGELLADLLEKDLMDLPMESAENEESPTEIAA